MRILLLEDDLESAAAIEKGLARDGHRLWNAATVADGIRLTAECDFDLAVLDIMLPDGSGYDVLDALRDAQPTTCIIMLTARGSIEDRVEGLDRGADDFLVKPFSFAELAARVRALSRRGERLPAVLEVDSLRVDTSRGLVSVSGKRLDLTLIQLNLLSHLLRADGGTVARRELLSQVWNYDFDPQTNLVDVHVNRLRRKLEEAGLRDLIITIRGEGYAIR